MFLTTLRHYYPQTKDFQLNVGECETCSVSARYILREQEGDKFRCCQCTYNKLRQDEKRARSLAQR